jgi:hypothetical protein
MYRLLEARKAVTMMHTLREKLMEAEAEAASFGAEWLSHEDFWRIVEGGDV